jgi:alkanesulfonate monooxygenase SsuD/methylene tetrahydromethanopterin reductase-like flavin-dependent oxidoreductase (luciferase family)
LRRTGDTRGDSAPRKFSGARALRRAARFADGWHALDASPKKIRDVAATLATFSPDRPVDISLRVRTAIGRATRPAPTSEDPGHGALEGEPDAIAAAILRYRDAGVTHIVIDPDTNALEQYLDDLETFAAEVRPLVIPQSERPPGSPMARQSDVLTTSTTRGSVE